MNPQTRRQASLYLSGLFQIEALRRRFNPIQARLIPAHVTLCREDEVADWAAFQANLEALQPFELTLTFGSPVRDQDFVFLPVCSGLDDFQAFRRKLLPREPRNHTPHVTLIHPRNGSCTDEIFGELTASLRSPFQYTFREVMLIEQTDGGVWRVIARVGKPDSSASGEETA